MEDPDNESVKLVRFLKISPNNEVNFVECDERLATEHNYSFGQLSYSAPQDRKFFYRQVYNSETANYRRFVTVSGNGGPVIV